MPTMTRSCVQCPDGSWVCGTGISQPDCSMSVEFDESHTGYYGQFTITQAPTTCRVFIRDNPHEPGEYVIVVRTR